MKQNKEFKIYKYGKLDIKDAVARELRFRASLFAEAGAEIGQCVVDSFLARN